MRALLGDAKPHQRQHLIEINREGLQARDPVLVILHRLKTQRVCEFVGELDAFALIDRQRPEPLRKLLNAQTGLVAHQVEIEAIVLRQLPRARF